VSDVTITNLVTPGGQRSRADDINARGQLVGLIERPGAAVPFAAVMWDKGRAEDLGLPPGYAFGATEAINASGTTVGWAVREGDQGHAFLWDHGLKRDLGVLPGDSNSTAHAINAAGDVVGVSTAGRLNTEQAVLWHKGKILGLGTLPGDIASEAFGIDAAGRVFGYSLRPTFTWRPFIWERGVMTELAGLDQPGVEFSITRRGDVVAWNCPDDAGGPKARATRRVGVITYIQCPKGESDDIIDINDINSSGQAVGTLYRRETPDGAWLSRPFVWLAGQSTPLPLLSGDPQGDANAINERGQIVGISFSGPTLRGVLWTLR
jgi:probable HAF family extracellular repeat protein